MIYDTYDWQYVNKDKLSIKQRQIEMDAEKQTVKQIRPTKKTNGDLGV